MLKNPLHAFRKDGKFFECSLFKVKIFPRNPSIAKRMNEIVAWRHMLKNNVITELPENIKKDNLFYHNIHDDVHLDFRPEHPFVEGPRIGISKDAESTNVVIATKIKKKTKKAAIMTLSNNAKDIEAFFFPNNSVYFADFQHLCDEIISALIHTYTYEGQVRNTYTEKSFIYNNIEDAYLYILKKAYYMKEHEMIDNFKKVDREFSDPNSIFSVNLN